MFIVSDQARWLTARTIQARGGMVMRSASRNPVVNMIKSFRAGVQDMALAEMETSRGQIYSSSFRSEPQSRTQRKVYQGPTSFIPDGKRLAYHDAGADRGPQSAARTMWPDRGFLYQVN